MKPQRLTRPMSRREAKAYYRTLRDTLDRAGVQRGQDFYIVPAAAVEGNDPRYQQIGADVVPLHHAGDPASSRSAAVGAFPRTGTKRLRVFEAVAAARGGLTAEECAARTGMRSSASGNSAAKRLSELRQGGWVAPSGETRRTSNGAQAEVLVLTSRGRAEYARRQRLSVVA